MSEMNERIGFKMSTSETRSLLKERGHSVLGLAKNDRGYGVPMSYGFDESEETIVLAAVNHLESKKSEFLESSREVTLTVYRYEDVERWESVIVTGTIHRIDPEAVADRSAAIFFAQADDAAADERWIQSEQHDRHWYELRPEEITGRDGGSVPQNPDD